MEKSPDSLLAELLALVAEHIGRLEELAVTPPFPS